MAFTRNVRCEGSRVVKEGHKSEVHMQLLVTMEKCHPRIVGDEVELELLKSAQHHHVFDHPGGRLAADARQLETMTV